MQGLDRAEADGVLARPDSGGSVRLISATPQAIRQLKDRIKAVAQEVRSNNPTSPYISISLSIYLSISIYLSLSLSIYLSIYVHTIPTSRPFLYPPFLFLP